MVPGDIGAELAAALRAMRQPDAAGAQPEPAGTWRSAPAEDGGGPGTYATSLPILLGRQAGREPGPIAAKLAGALTTVPWIAAARVTGPGYLTVTVTERHLSGLPARILAANLTDGPITHPLPDPAAAPDWSMAWKAQRDALVARLRQSAGTHNSSNAAKHPDGADRHPSPESPAGPVARAVAWHGADSVRYALARTPAPRHIAIERQLRLPLDLDNPFSAVRYAHAHAASTPRWAAGLGTGAEPAGSGERANIPEPAELALLDLLSWRDERLAAAARRGRPAELCSYLEQVAGAYLHCAHECPALPFGGGAAPDPAGPQAAARLELAAAARAVLAAGLRVAGVSCPGRMFDI